MLPTTSLETRDIDLALAHFSRGARALILDSHFTPEETPAHRGWGHSDWSQCAHFAAGCGANQLWLFHHKPGRPDEEMSQIERAAQEVFENTRAAKEEMPLRFNEQRRTKNEKRILAAVVAALLVFAAGALQPASRAQTPQSAGSVRGQPRSSGGRRPRHLRVHPLPPRSCATHVRPRPRRQLRRLSPPAGITFAPPPFVHFTNQTLRQIVRTSVGGSRLRVVLSNAFGSAPLTIGAAHIALRENDDAIRAGQGRPLTFSGRSSVTIPANAIVYSDPVALTVPPLSDLAVDLYLPGTTNTPAPLAMHNSAFQTSYISETGNHAGAAKLPAVATTRSWFLVVACRSRRAGRARCRRGIRRFDHRRRGVDSRHEQPVAGRPRQTPARRRRRP